MNSLIVSLSTTAPLRAWRRLYGHRVNKRAVDAVRHTVDPDEEEEEYESPTCSDPANRALSQCSPALYPVDSTPIPFTLHSDIPALPSCPNSFFDLHSTAQIEHPGGVPLCINGDPFDIRIKMRNPRKPALEPEVTDEVIYETRSRKFGQLVYISGAPLPTPEQVTQRTLKEYGRYADSDIANNYPNCEPLAHKPGPISLASSSSWQNTLRNNPDVLFRGVITPDTLRKSKSEPSKKPPAISRMSSAPSMMTQSDVPPMPPSIPVVSVSPDNCVDRPGVAPRYIDNNAAAPNAKNLTSVRHRPPPINTSVQRPSVPARDPSYRCFNPSPLKNVSASVLTPPSRSLSCSPELRTPISRSPALSDNGLKQSMWAPKV